MNKLNSNSTLLDLLKSGGKITFINGSTMFGDTTKDYIHCYDNDGDKVGCYCLNEEGLESALNDRYLFAQEEQE